MKLLLDNADKVRAQIGIITLDEDIQRTFETNTARPRGTY
jgi:DNA repair photolyase